MSLNKPKKTKLPKQEPIEEIQQVKEDETQAAQREKRKQVFAGGRQSTILAGIANALKKQLGE